MSTSLTAFAEAKLQRLQDRALRRALVPTHRLDGRHVERGGRQLLSFSCNDYLGLSHDPRVKAAAREAVQVYGVGAGASRLVTGDHPLLPRLEAELAAFKGYPAACVFGSGFLANAGLIPTFVGPEDAVVIDELAHACIWAGAQLSGARQVPFRHNDLDDLAARLAATRREARHILVATDGVFSMDGDMAPLDRISELCRAHAAWLLVDDAHGLGVVAGGRGCGAAFPTARIDLAMGTLSKALGGYGAYVCADRAVIDLIRNRTRTFVYTTGLPPASAAASLAALEIVRTEPDRVRRPLDHARRLTAALGLPPAQSAIVPIHIGEAPDALAAAQALAAEGLLAVAIRPPTVPPGTARLRLTFSAAHQAVDVARLIAALTRAGIPARVADPVDA